MLTKSKLYCVKSPKNENSKPARTVQIWLCLCAGMEYVWSEFADWKPPTSCWTLGPATSWGPLTHASTSISPKRRTQHSSGATRSHRGAELEEIPGGCTNPSTTDSRACQSTVSSPAWVSLKCTPQRLCNVYTLAFCLQYVLVKHTNLSSNCQLQQHIHSFQNYAVLTQAILVKYMHSFSDEFTCIWS